MYTNPRLKHVKKILDCLNSEEVRINEGVVYSEGQSPKEFLVKQCNLLLETKKKKECLHEHICCPGGIKTVRCAYCGKSMYKEPSPQPNDDGYYGASGAGNPHTSSPQPEIEELYMEGDFGDIAPSNEEITFKLNQVIDQLNKLIKTK